MTDDPSVGRADESGMKFINPDIGLGLIHMAGTNHLANAMLSAAQAMIPAKEIFAYRIADNGAPKRLLSFGMDEGAERRADAFASHFFISDPVRKTRYGIRPDTGFYQHVNISEIARGDYRWQCFEKPRFTDKLCFGWRRGGQSFVLTFYIQEEEGLPSTPLFEAFGNLSLTILMLHADKMDRLASPLSTRLHDEVLARYPGLTRREAEVCAMTLAGMTAEQIAAEIDATANTVLTYRQRAYQRLGIHSAYELLDAIIS